jgi:hypothetical protein
MPGGLMQLLAYGAQDIYMTSSPQISYLKIINGIFTKIRTEDSSEYINCSAFMKERKYENFDIIFDDLTVGKELYYCEDVIHLITINLHNLDNKSILINDIKTIKQNKCKLESLIREEKKKKKEEEKKTARRSSNNGTQFFSVNYRNIDANRRPQQRVQNREIKHQTKNIIQRR